MEAPCYKCERRVLGCHSNCEEYLEYSNGRKKYCAIKRRERYSDNEVLDVNFKILNNKRRRRDRK
jgi:hypothetical protein